jgi:hypothetical protein
MKRRTQARALGLAIVIGAATAGAALAQTQWDREHPRREEVNGRLP